MDGSTVEFWAAGLASARRKDIRLAAADAATAALDISRWEISALRQLALDRGLASSELDGLDAPASVALVRSHTAAIRASAVARTQLGGWLGGHTSFREYGAGLEEDAYVLLHGFRGDERADGAQAMPLAIAAVRARRLGAGVRKLASSVHAHGAWEERAIFDFLRAEAPSFAPFHAALTSEHKATDDVAAEASALSSYRILGLH